jgi:multisubunit Na+/H+ antiporter MnhB subunit
MRREIGLIALAIIIIFMALAAINMRDFGVPTNSDMDDYFIYSSQKETGANNVVTAIVFDYRGYDTLGEATVLFAAVSGVLVALRVARDRKEKGGGDQ